MNVNSQFFYIFTWFAEKFAAEMETFERETWKICKISKVEKYSKKKIYENKEFKKYSKNKFHKKKKTKTEKKSKTLLQFQFFIKKKT